MGASYIHGPCEENPVFCLSRDYGLLDPTALNKEHQAIYYDERPPWIPNWFSSSGRNQAASTLYQLFLLKSILMGSAKILYLCKQQII